MKNFLKMSCLLALVCLFNACKKDVSGTSSVLTHIPGDAGVIVLANPQKLMDKADFNTMKTMPFYADRIAKTGENNQAMAEIMKDPGKSGINLSQDACMVLFKESKESQDMFGGVVFVLSDPSAFASMVKGAMKESPVAQKGYQMVSKENNFVAWNDNLAIVGGTDKNGKATVGIERILATKADESIAENKDLKSFLKDSHDMSMWFNSNVVADNTDVLMGAGTLNIESDALKDNFIHGYVDFNQGELLAKSDFLFKKGLTQNIDMLFKDGIKTDFSKYVKGGTQGFTMTAALDFKGLKQLLAENQQLSGMTNLTLKSNGLNLDDITKALDGDIMVSGLPGEDGKFNGIFAAKINDKASLQKLIGFGEQVKMLVKESEGIYKLQYDKQVNNASFDMNFKWKADNIRLLIINDMLFVTGDPDIVQSLKQGKPVGTGSSDALALSKDNVFALVSTGLDLQKFGKTEANDLTESTKITTNRKGGTLRITFKDKQNNSLKTLVQKMNADYLKK